MSKFLPEAKKESVKKISGNIPASLHTECREYIEHHGRKNFDEFLSNLIVYGLKADKDWQRRKKDQADKKKPPAEDGAAK